MSVPNNNNREQCRTGYGPSPSANRLYFDGNDEKYDLWEIKFLSYLRIQKLLTVVEAADPNAEANARVFAELVQFLDDKSLQLIMRDAKDDGKGALRILREHYRGSSKPRVIALYTELTSLCMKSESLIDYIIRAENDSTSLKTAGEVVSDSLLIAMVLLLLITVINSLMFLAIFRMQ